MGETTPTSFISIFSRDKKKALDSDGNGVPLRKGMRRSSSVGIFKAALGMLRTKSVGDLTVSDSKPDQVDVDSKVGQKGDVGSERPMQSQSSPLSPPHPPPENVTLEIVPVPEPEPISGEEHKDEATASSLSPTLPVSEVNQNDSPREGIAKEKCGHHCDNEGGDEKIDIKAEEFIAQFYEQMRLQASNS